MPEGSKQPLKVFLCHASGDKPQVRALYKRLLAEGVDAWLDNEKLLPGQDWRVEIPKAVKEADVVVICLSNKSITKEGYIQKEIKFALDIAEEKPEGSIFLIPARLEECPVPDHMSRWQWVDLYEENGFVKLLRSLKLRADKLGVVVESSSNMEDDKEVERRINQLYTEGLAAFYTEDWDRACRRFQTILSERPNHKNATEKLEEAERQKDLARLYAQATEAYQAEQWSAALKSLEEISKKLGDYKDVPQLLRNARKQKQLGELYAEAKTLHAAQKWHAVVRVFDQISMIDPTYQDADGLLPSAQKELAEVRRLTELNDLYTNAVHEMSAGRWYEARTLLEQVHKSQIGFLETDGLLRKTENEIGKIEEIKRRNDQINTLYEQANGLVRARNWRKALEKMDEIQTLDDQFADKDGIVEKVNKELIKEEEEAQRQNDLAARYADAVNLMREGKYREALDQWQEVRSIDQKYPDRQRVESIARRKLKEIDKPLQTKPEIFLARPLWAGIIGFLVIGVLTAGILLSRRNNVQNTISIYTYEDIPRVDVLVSSTVDMNSWDPRNAIDGDGNTNWSSNGYSEPEHTEWIVIDMGATQNLERIRVVPREGGGAGFPQDFKFQAGDNGIDWIDISGQEYNDYPNPGSGDKLFNFASPVTARYIRMVATKLGDDGTGVFYFQLEDIYPQSVSISTVSGETDLLMYDDFDNPEYDGSFNTAIWSGDTSIGSIAQRNGSLILQVNGSNQSISLSSKQEFKPINPVFVESKLMLDPSTQKGAHVSMGFYSSDGYAVCAIWSDGGTQNISCWSVFFDVTYDSFNLEIIPGSWHQVRIELYPDSMTFVYNVDGKEMGSYIPSAPNQLKSLSYSHVLLGWTGELSAPDVTGYADYIKTGEINKPETAPVAYRWDFVDNSEGWGDDFRNDIRDLNALNGYLIFQSIGEDPYFSSPASLNISATTPIITIRMRLLGQGSYGGFSFVTDKDNNWEGGTKSAFFTIENDGAFHTYDVVMPPTWQDTITQLRLDPVEDGTADSQVDIDYISVHAP